MNQLNKVKTEQEIGNIIQSNVDNKLHRKDMQDHYKEIVNQAISMGVRFVHVRNVDMHGDIMSTGGSTVCYMPNQDLDIKQTNLFRMSIALCHPREIYNKELGRYYSAINFINNQTILLNRGSRNIHYTDYIQEKFTNVV